MASTFDPSPQNGPPSNSLKFSNYTGKDVSPEMSKYYLQLIEQGYLFYARDLDRNTLFIQSRLEQKYNKKYNVVIVPENVKGGFACFSWNYV